MARVLILTPVAWLLKSLGSSKKKEKRRRRRPANGRNRDEPIRPDVSKRSERGRVMRL